MEKKSIDRARWLIAQYREISPEHEGADIQTIIGDLVGDLRYLAQCYNYKWEDINSISIVAELSIAENN